ncbi:MAG: ArsR family transcriptional regulator [Chloroflexi bacterium]|nr:ArsR family transcriptional regulator [Chloroflexota bacterium]
MQTTRRRILALLRQRRQATVEDLAETLGVSPMAVRHHLSVLTGQGSVELARLERCGRPGRPRQVFALTAIGEARFPDGAGLLCQALLQELHQRLPAAEWHGLAARAARRVLAPVGGGGAPLPVEGRLQRAARYLERQGVTLGWYVEWNGNLVLRMGCPHPKADQPPEWACDWCRVLLAGLLEVPAQELVWAGPAREGCLYRLAAASP